MVDLDGVENGDQGKSRKPHDHNRDYVEDPIYPTVRAIKELVDRLSEEGLALYIDFHCPWIRNGGNEAVFFAEPPEPYASQLHRLAGILKTMDTGPLAYTGNFDVPFGTSWNVAKSNGQSSSGYVREHGGPALLTAATLETSYSTTEGAVATPETARQFGRALGQAIDRFLSS